MALEFYSMQYLSYVGEICKPSTLQYLPVQYLLYSTYSTFSAYVQYQFSAGTDLTSEATNTYLPALTELYYKSQVRWCLLQGTRFTSVFYFPSPISFFLNAITHVDLPNRSLKAGMPNRNE